MFPNWFENKTVAVVGNSTSQLLRKDGDDIDRHDIVIRFNHALEKKRIEQNNLSTGKKTDVWVLWHFYDWKRFYIPFTGLKLHVGHEHYNDSEADYILSLENFKIVSREANVILPSSGILTLYILKNCNPSCVNIYGFDWKKTPSFYHNSIITHPHDFNKEKIWCENNILNKENYKLHV